MFEDNGNKCGKCQNHDFEILKKGHARDCPFKKCSCLKCRLLDARSLKRSSDILQVISGKETKLKGTKKDPNCGFCQNHGVKILRKGHVRSCGYGQERHFRLDDCFDCEVHYIRNEVNRLQIKMRRAMKEDRTLSEEQRKTAREAITRDEVEKVCGMARLARKKRALLTQQTVIGSPINNATIGGCGESSTGVEPNNDCNSTPGQAGVWRPWSQPMLTGHHSPPVSIYATSNRNIMTERPLSLVSSHHELQQPQNLVSRDMQAQDLVTTREPLHLQQELQPQDLFGTIFRLIFESMNNLESSR